MENNFTNIDMDEISRMNFDPYNVCWPSYKIQVCV